jgi:hypothetical protein
MKRNQGEDYVRDTAKIDYPKQIRINFCTCSEKSKVIIPCKFGKITEIIREELFCNFCRLDTYSL